MIHRFMVAFLVLVIAAVLAAPSRGASQELVIESFDTVDHCRGLERDTVTVKVGTASGRWSRMDKTGSITCSAAPHDWSGYNGLSLWVYNGVRLDGAAFMLILGSASKGRRGLDYYSLRFDLGRWTGWRHFVVPLSELGAARNPIGWHQIDDVVFTAQGWGNTPHPEAVVHFDDFRLVNLPKIEGPRMTDRELFEAMNCDYPGMEAVKKAVSSGDLEAAKVAWLAHLKTRTVPKWFIDWRQRPKARGSAPAGGSPGWDYYQRSIRLDWSGWKHFRLTKADFRPARSPLGWNWIDFIQFSAAGFGLTSDPHAILYFDDFRLVGKERTVRLGGFDNGASAWLGLSPSDEHARDGRFSGKWAQMHVTSRIRLSELPTDWTDVEALEFWCYAPRVTGARLVLILDSDRPVYPAADQVVKHVIQSHDFGPDINWSADPHSYREWTYGINRFYHWSTLCETYWESGDETYAREFCNQLVDWVRKNPVPQFASGNGSYTWRTIECGIRQSTTWPDCLYRVLGSPSFTPHVAAVMTKSMVEHARHLMEWHSKGGNWLTMESNGLGTIGILLPEFREAAQWRTAALKWQYAELDNQVYADGAQIELTTGYHQVSLNNFLGLARTAILNGIPIPQDYYARLRRMFDYNLWVAMPNGRTPALNDGSHVDIQSSMATAYELYHDPVFDWAASRGARGTAPDHTSHFFPYAGQMVMRSGWRPEDRYLLMDAGPFGLGHQHEDKLSVVVYGLGRMHILDPGNYDYDSSPWRKYTIDTPAHNTVMVDGLSQGRHNRPKSEYVVNRPPPSNVWLTADRLDYGAGCYEEGYGSRNELKIVHGRQVVFVKPDYWLVVDTLSGTGEHRYESLFHFDADEAEIDAARATARTIDPTSNCLIAASPQPGLDVRIVKGQTEPAIQGFVAGERWRPSWKDPKATRPEHGKREVPTAVFALRAQAPARFVYVIYPYAAGQKPQLTVEDITQPGRPVTVRVTLPDGTVDQIVVHQGAQVTRAQRGAKPEPWASLTQ